MGRYWPPRRSPTRTRPSRAGGQTRRGRRHEGGRRGARQTPAVARGSYVDPRVVAGYEQGLTIAAATRRAEHAREPDVAQEILEKATRMLIRRVAKGHNASGHRPCPKAREPREQSQVAPHCLKSTPSNANEFAGTAILTRSHSRHTCQFQGRSGSVVGSGKNGRITTAIAGMPRRVGSANAARAGHTVVVTAASGGIGRPTAQATGASGRHVDPVARSEKTLTGAAHNPESPGGATHAIQDIDQVLRRGAVARVRHSTLHDGPDAGGPA